MPILRRKVCHRDILPNFDYINSETVLYFFPAEDAMLPLRKSLRRRLSSTSPSVYSGDSDSDDEDEDEEPKVVKKVEEKYPVSMMRIIKLNGKEWPYILLGSIAAIIMGASLPTFAIIFGEYFEVY